jgi:hypothetical protein
MSTPINTATLLNENSSVSSSDSSSVKDELNADSLQTRKRADNFANWLPFFENTGKRQEQLQGNTSGILLANVENSVGNLGEGELTARSFTNTGSPVLVRSGLEQRVMEEVGETREAFGTTVLGQGTIKLTDNQQSRRAAGTSDVPDSAEWSTETLSASDTPHYFREHVEINGAFNFLNIDNKSMISSVASSARISGQNPVTTIGESGAPDSDQMLVESTGAFDSPDTDPRRIEATVVSGTENSYLLPTRASDIAYFTPKHSESLRTSISLEYEKSMATTELSPDSAQETLDVTSTTVKWIARERAARNPDFDRLWQELDSASSYLNVTRLAVEEAIFGSASAGRGNGSRDAVAKEKPPNSVEPELRSLLYYGTPLILLVLLVSLILCLFRGRVRRLFAGNVVSPAPSCLSAADSAVTPETEMKSGRALLMDGREEAWQPSATPPKSLFLRPQLPEIHVV